MQNVWRSKNATTKDREYLEEQCCSLANAILGAQRLEPIMRKVVEARFQSSMGNTSASNGSNEN